MAESLACEKWGDGSWWQATIPEGWQCKRDQSIKGWPYVFTRPDAKLIIHQSFSGGLYSYSSAWDSPLFPASARSDTEREMYRDAATDLDRYLTRMGPTPSIDELQKALANHQFNELVGYSYEFEIDGRRAWRGYFAYERWNLCTILVCNESTFDDSLKISLEIISSVRFFSDVASKDGR